MTNTTATLHDEFLQTEKPFDIEQLLQHEAKKLQAIEPEAIELRIQARFLDICDIVKTQLSNTIDIGDDDTYQSNAEWLDRQHKAVIGDAAAVQYFIEEISKVLRDRNISFREYPKFYSSLAEAIFHEVWGLSVLAKWENYQDSEAALIHGTSLWIDYGKGKGFELQREHFASEAVVERVKRAFIHRREDSVLNRETPEIEIEREDGSRITMIQPPRSRENYVMLRRFVVDRFTLEDQASRDTIPFADIPIYRALARTLPNMIVAGRVRSAKSTFMKTLIGERDPSLVGAVLEKHFELALGRHLTGRLFMELQAKEGDLHNVIPRLLRLEHDFVVIGEIRSLEIEAYLQATERGERGAISTYHLTDVHRVIPQLTRHTLDEFPTRRFEVELERVASSVDIVITMASDRDRKKKRVTGVTEISWNDDTKSVEVNELIKYSALTNSYTYSNNISKRLLHLMATEDLKETKILMKLLKDRTEESPMKIENEYEDLDRLLFEGEA
ncbi:MAG: ATPase, T2SS/T4P/T4SS family [Paenisporosarcina sp.]|nr:ATPase, T2SS/T4P/T4SS family [Paenisporosarcina sp.]